MLFLFLIFARRCTCVLHTNTLQTKHACMHTHTYTFKFSLLLGRSKVWIGLSFIHSTAGWVCVCACVWGGVQLIQVLSRREDKNLLPACSLVGPLNQERGWPQQPLGPVCLIAETPFTERERETIRRRKTTCGREGAGIYLKLHITNLCKH